MNLLSVTLGEANHLNKQKLNTNIILKMDIVWNNIKQFNSFEYLMKMV